jgi:thiol-disulfide isomerase/thioredoxin
VKKRILLVIVLVFLSGWLFPDEQELIKQLNQLNEQKEYSKALELVDKGLSEFGDSIALLAQKSQILVNLNKLEEAFNVAVKRSEVSERKSPWHCLDIVVICLKMKDMDRAFEWLNKAVDRGFLSYTELYDDENFKLLTKDKRLDLIVKKIKDNIGMGKPAKDFSIELLSGEKFVLSKQKGKVILIDFWATWCHPCVEGIPHLKEFYQQYKDKGFDIIGISLDSDKKALADYLAKENLPWKIAFSGKAWFDDTAKSYNVNLIPSYWLIDREGVLRNFGVPLRDKEKMKSAIEELVYSRNTDLKDLSWLVGQWQGQVNEATYNESWSQPRQGTLDGSASMVDRSGKTIFSEKLHIEKIGMHVVYIASVNNQPPVLFTLSEVTWEGNRPRWVFENREHDFPQRIIYIREAPDSLTARVEGVQSGKEEKEEFHLKRK